MIRWLIRVGVLAIAMVCGLVALGYGLLVLLSLHKTPLDADVAAFLQPEPIAVAPERNGFYFWIGLNAPAGEDPIQYGRRAIGELGKPLAQAASTRTDRELRVVSFDRKAVCSPELRSPCLPTAKANAARIRLMARENAELFRRFVALVQTEEFATDMPVLNPMDPIPARQDQMSVFMLARTLDALDASEGRMTEAIARQAPRVAFLRRMHANSSSLIDRVIAQALLAKEFELLAELVAADPEAAKRSAAQIAAMAAPMTAAERSPLRWIRSEFAEKYATVDPANRRAWPYAVCQAVLGAQAVELMMDDKLDARCARWDVRSLALVAGPLMDRNGMANRRFESIRGLRRIDAPDSFAYVAQFREVVASAEARRGQAGLHLLNPLGEWIGSRLSTDLVSEAQMYHLSAIDLDRLYALARLAAKLSLERVRDGDNAASIERSEVRDPATNGPFRWDASRRQVFFEPLDPWIAARGRVGGIDGRVGLAVR